MALPRSVLMDLFAGSALAASLVGFGMLLPLAAVMHTILAVRTSKSVLHARLAVATTLLTMMVMVAVRQVVRSRLSSALRQYPRNACQSTVERHWVISAAVRSWTDYGVLDARADLEFDAYGSCGLAGSGRLAKARRRIFSTSLHLRARS